MTAIPAFYDQPRAMEPMVPVPRPELAELTMEIARHSGELESHLPSEITKTAIRDLIAAMNSYYSNLIEGHKTYPFEIEKAIAGDYSENEKERANQSLSKAHIAVEKKMVRLLEKDPELDVHSSDFLCGLHRDFYEELPEEFHYSDTRSGKRYKVIPGTIRNFHVDVGAHLPPHFEAIPKFLARFDAFYSSPINATDRLVAIAAAHHRLAWIHPFGDGNGRVARLYSQASLIRYGVSKTTSLWSLSRGLARFRADYFTALKKADSTRMGDYDGRGNLSDRTLADFCKFFLKTIDDQIQFMSGCLKLQDFSKRISRYLQFQALHIEKHREQLDRLLRAILVEGEVARGQVPAIVSRKGTIAREVITLGLKEGLLSTKGPKGSLRLAFPPQVLSSYFPDLFINLPE